MPESAGALWHDDRWLRAAFRTNHLGHFALTGRLLPLLQEGRAARVVSVSSIAHRTADLDFENLQYDGGAGYEPMLAYRRSKLANLLFGYELDRRLRSRGFEVRSVVAHPGLSATNLASHLDGRWWWRAARPAVGLFIQSAKMGALPTLRAGTDDGVLGGQYNGPSGRRETRGTPVQRQSSSASHNRAAAARLWERSEELTGLRYL